jgi:O-antigen ligase
VEAVLAIGQNITRSDLGLGFFGAARFIKGHAGLLTLTRVMGTLGHPSQLAQFFDMTLPISLALLFTPMRRSFKIMLAGAVALQYLGLGLTYSRGGIFWTSLAMAIIVLVALSRRLGWLRGVIFSATLGVMFVALLLVVPNPITKGLMRTEYETAYGRLPLMQVAFNIIKDRPFFGVGPNNYVYAALRYDNTPAQLTTQWNTAVHNVYLFIAGEYGAPALLLFLGFLGSVGLMVMPAIKSPDFFLAYLGLGVFWGFTAFLLHCYTDFTQWTSPRLHWFLLGLMVSLGRLARQSEPAPAAA